MSTPLEQITQLETATRVRRSAIYNEIASLRADRAVNLTILERLTTLKQRRSVLDKEISKISSFKEYLCKAKGEKESVWAISDSLTHIEEFRKFYMSFDHS